MNVLEQTMTEDDLLVAIVEAARFLGWRVHHDRRSDKAIQQGDAGFPDLVMARHGHVLFWELKGSRGQLTTEQWGWLQALGHAGKVIRPADLDAALAALA